MLEQLYIKNFILIDEVTIPFSSGFNVLSGETGAGKSLIIDAVELICGERGKGEYLKDSQKSAWIEAVFTYQNQPDLENWMREQGWEIGEEPLVLSREIRRDGRSVSRFNGRIVSLSILREISSFLLDLHGQNDRQNLLQSRHYLTYIDSFVSGGKETREKLAQAYELWQNKVKEKQKLELDERERLQKLDFLNFQIDEIEKVHLEEGEEEQLTEQHSRIQNAENLAKNARKISHLLFDGENAADGSIYQAMEAAKHAADDSFFEQLAVELESVYYELQERKYQLNDFQNQLEIEPGRLDEVEERLYQIHTLEKKYGAGIPDILENYHKMLEQKEVLENISGHAEKISQEIQQRYQEYETIAFEMREKRRQAKAVLEDCIRKELQELNLPNLRFEIQLKEKKVPERSGLDEAEFLFSANPGEPLRLLSKIASGGELSRFTLALKIALAEKYHVQSIILDEIDVGLGGMAQHSMALKLCRFSQTRQLLLVTHAAKIAAFAEKHFQISKSVIDGETYSSVCELGMPQRTKELARMLDGGQFSEISLHHAEQLLQDAAKYRIQNQKRQ